MSSQPTAGRILLAEDEKSLAKGISYNFEKRGYEVLVVGRGDSALEAACTQAFDLILLDVMMPGLDGFQVCQQLRERRILTPILMLTARSELDNRIKGIGLGADDYLGKPFSLDELIARVEALLRRRRWDAQPSTKPHLPIEFEGVQFDANLLRLKGKGAEIELTAIEAKLLELLLHESGKTIPRTQILKMVWGLHEETQTRTLDNFIMRLRHHLSKVGGSAEWIESVRGIGYRFISLEPKSKS